MPCSMDQWATLTAHTNSKRTSHRYKRPKYGRDGDTSRLLLISFKAAYARKKGDHISPHTPHTHIDVHANTYQQQRRQGAQNNALSLLRILKYANLTHTTPFKQYHIDAGDRTKEGEGERMADTICAELSITRKTWQKERKKEREKPQTRNKEKKNHRGVHADVWMNVSIFKRTVARVFGQDTHQQADKENMASISQHTMCIC